MILELIWEVSPIFYDNHPVYLRGYGAQNRRQRKGLISGRDEQSDTFPVIHIKISFPSALFSKLEIIFYVFWRKIIS